MARLDRDAELVQLALHLDHEGEHPLRDRAEVMVLELLALGRLGAEERAPDVTRSGVAIEVLLVDQEVLLLATRSS